MEARPFINFRFDQIEAHTKKHWNDKAVLKLIADELQLRTRPNARALLVKVEGRLAELKAGSGKKEGASEADRERDRLRREIERLNKALQAAASGIAAAEARAKAAEARTRQTDRHGFHDVGLHPSCPDFLLTAARRAFRFEYHPDRLINRPPAEQKAGEEAFKRFDAIFERLLGIRAKRAA